ncbi:unnamed protein product [Linum tenue]|uniref:Acyl carrier protein n=1 Tax=Linum tenue TaxID=586396 RepID=A0AAV0LDV7_9ROSI|nr:unnamed protein product [Linum tenue]CAI0432331.1 unnamed protein product [Linum tenue]
MAAASTSSFIPLKPRPTPRGLSTIAVLKLGAPLSFSFRRPVLAPARLRISCVVEIVMGLEEEFDISVEEDSAQSIATVQDAADLIEELVRKKCA